MIRTDNRIDAKRRANLDHRKQHFRTPAHAAPAYPHRLNFYGTAPTADITLEQFETWAIDRLRVLAELEACQFRNRSGAETAAHIKPLLERHLALASNTAGSGAAATAERQKDHYSHFILRLAFCATEELRRRFVRAESTLFRLRFLADDPGERAAFVASLSLDWQVCGEEERRRYAEQLSAAAGGWVRRVDEESWFKVDWTRVPELVERRGVFVRAGKAYVPGREQASMVVAEFGSRLERALEVSAGSAPRAG
jgi:DNA primase large subunit